MQIGHKREVAETERNAPEALHKGSRSCFVCVTAATVHHISVHILIRKTICSLLKGRHLLAATQS